MTETFKTLPVRSYASLNVMLPLVQKLALRAQSTVSNRAPVFHQRRIQTGSGSEQAVIMSESEGTRSRSSSESV